MGNCRRKIVYLFLLIIITGCISSRDLLYDGIIEDNCLKVEKSILKGNNVDKFKNNCLESPLELSVILGRTEILKILINNGGDYRLKDSKGFSLLHIAVIVGKIETINLLLDYISPNIVTSSCPSSEIFGITPLMIAASSGKTNLTKLLLQNGANPNITDSRGENSLDYATRICNEKIKKEIAQLLLDYGAKINED